jgi:hypothetical protein
MKRPFFAQLSRVTELLKQNGCCCTCVSKCFPNILAENSLSILQLSLHGYIPQMGSFVCSIGRFFLTTAASLASPMLALAAVCAPNYLSIIQLAGRREEKKEK